MSTDNLTSATPTPKQKIKTPFAKIIVSHIESHAYFSIMWWDIQTMTMYEGYGSYGLKIVQKWLEEEFEIDEHARAELLVKTRDAAPAANAVEVVHGRWLYDSGSGKYFCSACDEYALSFKKDTLYGDDLYEVCLTDYCPNCGAKMDGGNEDGKRD